MAELKRGLGFGTILALSISSIAGTGLFFGAALGAGIAGNASLVSWVLTALIAIYIAACFSELTSLFPKAGGIYEFSKQAYGKFVSFLVGWTAWVVNNVTTTLLVVAAIDYLTPAQFPLVFKIAISLLFIIILNIIAFIGLEASGAALIVFALITISLPLIVGIPAASTINFENFRPFFTHGFIPVIIASFLLAETFFGWESVTFLAEETKNPEKVIPKALMWGTIGVSVMAISLAVIMLGNTHWQVLGGVGTPLTSLAEQVYGVLGSYITPIGVYLIMIGSAAGGIISSPRLLMALARDKLFLKQFSAIHEKYKTPYKAIMFQAVIAVIIVIIGFGDYIKLLSLLIPMAVMMYVLSMLAVSVLRKKKPTAKREFNVWLPRHGPIIISLLLIGSLVVWIAQNNLGVFIKSLGLIALGIPVYFLLQMYYNPKMINTVHDRLSFLMLWTENVFTPKKIRKEIMYLLGDIKGKKVLEYGCSVGTLTQELASEVGKKGKVWAINGSKHQAYFTKSRMIKKGHTHVDVIHHYKETMHDDVGKVDAAVSVGALSYVQNPDKLLREISKKMSKGSKIIFVDYDSLFLLIPNVHWINNDKKLKGIFEKSGFRVVVVRRESLLWQHVFVYGKKI